MAKSKRGKDRFHFKKFDTIGAMDGHDDTEFLPECFVDNPGLLECLIDPARLERIVLGRTGAGKTALIEQLKSAEERVRVVEPENLSLQYLSNSPILLYLEEQKVHLELFYKLLWKHVFLVELLQMKFSSAGSLTDWINKQFPSKTERSANQYMEDWRGSFFSVMEKRVVEMEEKLVSKIAGEVGVNSELVRAKISGSDAMSETEKVTYHMKAQAVVSQLQIEQLNQIIESVAKDLFSKPTPRFYLVLDKLDEHWADNRFRYQLVRTLIDTIREFSQKFKSVKIVIAIREDLLQAVFKYAKREGLQEQKYTSFYLKLNWSQRDLMQVLEKRLRRLCQKKGFSRDHPIKDLFPDRINAEPFSNYFIRRTLFTPRDVVDFFNRCIKHAEGKEKIGPEIVRTAEGEYSTARLIALYEEWASVYPNLKSATSLLKAMPKSFTLESLAQDRIEALGVTLERPEESDDISRLLSKYYEGGCSIGDVRRDIAHIFYKVGMLGFKMDNFQSTVWSFRESTYVAPQEIVSLTKCEICPAFFRSLGVNPGSSSGGNQMDGSEGEEAGI